MVPPEDGGAWDQASDAAAATNGFPPLSPISLLSVGLPADEGGVDHLGEEAVPRRHGALVLALALVVEAEDPALPEGPSVGDGLVLEPPVPEPLVHLLAPAVAEPQEAREAATGGRRRLSAFLFVLLVLLLFRRLLP